MVNTTDWYWFWLVNSTVTAQLVYRVLRIVWRHWPAPIRPIKKLANNPFYKNCRSASLALIGRFWSQDKRNCVRFVKGRITSFEQKHNFFPPAHPKLKEKKQQKQYMVYKSRKRKLEMEFLYSHKGVSAMTMQSTFCKRPTKKWDDLVVPYENRKTRKLELHRSDILEENSLPAISKLRFVWYMLSFMLLRATRGTPPSYLASSFPLISGREHAQ